MKMDRTELWPSPLEAEAEQGQLTSLVALASAAEARALLALRPSASAAWAVELATQKA